MTFSTENTSTLSTSIDDSLQTGELSSNHDLTSKTSHNFPTSEQFSNLGTFKSSPTIVSTLSPDTTTVITTNFNKPSNSGEHEAATSNTVADLSVTSEYKSDSSSNLDDTILTTVNLSTLNSTSLNQNAAEIINPNLISTAIVTITSVELSESNHSTTLPSFNSPATASSSSATTSSETTPPTTSTTVNDDLQFDFTNSETSKNSSNDSTNIAQITTKLLKSKKL